MSNKKTNYKSVVLYILIPLMLIFALFFVNQTTKTQTKSKEYSEVVNMIKTYEISEFELNWYSGKLTYKLRSEGTKGKIYTYTVADSSIFYNDVNDFVLESNAAGEEGKTFVYDFKKGGEGALLVNLLPYILLGALMIFGWIFVMRRMNQSMGNDKMMGFGKAKIKKPSDKRKTTFADVAGADEEKQELEEIVEFLKNPQKFNELGARIPKGVLLVGPPGTGKTLLARAVAGEAGVPFFSISGSDFVEMYVGVGASRLRDLFEEAKKNAPAIILID